MLVGAIGVVDLRVLGLWKRLPLEALSRALTPVAVMGFFIMVPTGVVLFAADGPALAMSDIFERKLVLIVVALANAAASSCRIRPGSTPASSVLRPSVPRSGILPE